MDDAQNAIRVAKLATGTDERIALLAPVICPMLPDVSRGDCMMLTPGREAAPCNPDNCISARIALAVLKALHNAQSTDTSTVMQDGDDGG